MHELHDITLSWGLFGMFSSWAVWVTVMIFELKAKIALLKQEIAVLTEVKRVLMEIREDLHAKRHR